MPIDDDPIDVQLGQIKQDFDGDIDRQLAAATRAGLLSLAPGVGKAIQSLLDGKAQRNVQLRWVQLFHDMKARLDEIRDSIPTAEYYGSEEFQTLLALAFEQLWTTHDEQKRRLLANGLANSGSSEFVKEPSKEQFVRVLRDLSAEEILILRDMSLGAAEPVEMLPGLARLVSLGLVRESISMQAWNTNTIPARVNTVEDALKALHEFRRAMARYLQQRPVRSHTLSDFGKRFLEFLAIT